MSLYTNQTGVPLSLAVFLATDNYDYEPDTISATALLKPVRQAVLAKRVPAEDNVMDITGLVKSRMGNAIHDAIEKAWLTNYEVAMKALGYPQKIIDKVVINPDPDKVEPGQIPVYMEQRSYREVMGVTISGKYDFLAEGRIEDFKTTSVYTYMQGRKDEDYQLQGSIYRWLNPKIVTADHMAIQFLFTDWMPGRAAQDEKYPSTSVLQHKIPLLSLEATENFIRDKLTQIQRFKDTPEDQLPRCNDKELWRKDPMWKYYKNPAKKTRSTKNFDNAAEAYARKAKDGNVGEVVEVPGEVVACKYCPAFPVCTQKDDLIASGELQL